MECTSFRETTYWCPPWLAWGGGSLLLSPDLRRDAVAHGTGTRLDQDFSNLLCSQSASTPPPPPPPTWNRRHMLSLPQDTTPASTLREQHTDTPTSYQLVCQASSSLPAACAQSLSARPSDTSHFFEPKRRVKDVMSYHPPLLILVLILVLVLQVGRQPVAFSMHGMSAPLGS